MYLIHGAWIPDETEEFLQRGNFYLWVETDLPAGCPKPGGDATVHPRQLAGPTLTAFLGEKLGLPAAAIGRAPSSPGPIYFQLPSAAGAPLPSFELQPYVDSEVPDTFELATWQVCGYRVPNVIATLNDVYYVAAHAPDEFQLGTDFLFWHQLSRVVKQVIVKDQYIPALKYREVGPAKGQRARGAPRFEIQAGWEIVSDAYEAAVPRYVASMPRVCRAGSTTPTNGDLYDGETLMRHFAECALQAAIAATPFTARLDGQLAGSLLSDCVYPDRPSPPRNDRAAALEEYRQWVAWREKLVLAQTTAEFTLGFRLDEPAADGEGWPVHFLVAARHDPSFKLSLADYWELDRSSRADLGPHFGADFEKRLLLALGHAARVYPKVWEGLETDAPTGFRLDLADAYAFLKESAWVLEDAGYLVMVPAWWTPAGRRRAKVRLKTAARSGKAGAATAGGYFSLDRLVAYHYQLMIGDQAVGEEEWRQLVAAKTPLVQFRGQWIELDRDKMAQLLEFWRKRQPGELELSLPDFLKLAAESEDDLEWEHDAPLRDVLAHLADKGAFAPIQDLPRLNGTLRDYQKRGVAWLGYLEGLGLNPCLADDMGLGKTLEVIGHLLREREAADRIPPTLVVAPTSVLSNWRKEIERFAPDLHAVVHHGTGRPRDERAFREACGACDVVITSFALARLDEKLLRSVEWRRVVVDEAQNIKNPEAAQTRAVQKLPAQHRLALTGTPVENRLLDLWSIFNFLNPGYLGKQAQFRKTFELPIQKDDDRARAATLKKLVEPFILRRVKTDRRIIDDLPDKIEQKQFCNLTPEQASLYAAVVADVEEQLEQVDGIQRRGLILATLTRLKQVCNHPAQFLQDGSAFTVERSHKLQRLSEMVDEAIEGGESLLVFTQFAEIGAALEGYLARTLRRPTYYLHGGTSV
ncbi:MAG: DEAD/DEAH box helicase, partial [Chloroflexota bacterium]